MRWWRRRLLPMGATMMRWPGVVIPWLVILLICGGMLVLTTTEKRQSAGKDGAPAVGPAETLSGKYAIGVVELLGESQRQAMLKQTTAGLGDGVAGRISAAVLTAALRDMDTAIEQLSAIRHPDAASMLSVLIGESPQDPTVMRRYGFYAELAASLARPAGDAAREAVRAAAVRTSVVLIGFLGLAGMGLLAGCVLLAVGAVMWWSGALRWSSPPPRGDPAVYVQGFVVYLASLLGLSAVLGQKEVFALNLLSPVLATVAGMVFIVSRVAEGKVVRWDLGLHTGRGLWAEVFWGSIGYLAGLPIVAIGLLMTLVLTRVSGADASHPIGELVSEHAVWVAVLAVVLAPVTEELFFRGALQAHCRAWMRPMVAGLLTGLVFASIHPQGWAGLPVLTAIGFVLSMIREWRGSLVGPVVGHAINNGVVTCLLLLVV